MEQGTVRNIKTSKTVVLGATGMVGAHLTARLLLEGYRNIVLPVRNRKHLPRLQRVLRYHGIEGIEGDGLQIAETPYYNSAALAALIDGADAVFHCAAAISASPGRSQRMIADNVAVTHAVTEACLRAGAGRLVYVSSVAALGIPEAGKATDEDTAFQSLAGRSPYSVSKFYSENEVWRAHADGLDVTVANPAVILGYGDWHTHNTPRLFRMIYKGLPFAASGEVGYVSARDVARALVVLATEGSNVSGQRFVLSNEQLTYRALFSQMAEALQVKPPRWVLPDSLLKRAARCADTLERWGIRCPIDRNMLESVTKRLRYDGRRITEQTPFRYTPLKEDIAAMGRQFRIDFARR